MDAIPVSRPCIGDDELAGLRRVLDSRWLGLGAVSQQFEEALAQFIDPSGATTVVAVNTGTTALHLALEAIGTRAGDEVILPALTFVATAQVVTALNATPIFCDVAPDTLTMDIRDLERCLSPRTRTIVPVHYRGQSCDMDGVLRIAKSSAVAVIEDAAHAVGSYYHDRRIGSFGDMTCFSFDPIKNITCGEGGAITLRDRTLADRLRRKRILGIDQDTWSRNQLERPWHYDVVEQGFRYHLPNLNAAIGLAQIANYDRMQQKKNAIARSYDQAFGRLPGLRVIETDYDKTAIFSYILCVLNGRRSALMDVLKKDGIGSGVHYIPVHHFHYFKSFAMRHLPHTDALFDQILTLPLFADMTDTQVQRVIDSVTRWARNHS